jgi:hypothetical protein
MTAFAHRLDVADPVLFVPHQYNSKDRAFAYRLYSRMAQYKLRIWYVPEDMRGGIWPRSTGERRNADEPSILAQRASVGSTEATSAESASVSSDRSRLTSRDGISPAERGVIPDSATQAGPIRRWSRLWV